MYILCIALPSHCCFSSSCFTTSGLNDWAIIFLHSMMSHASLKALLPEGVVMGVRPEAFTLSPSRPEVVPQTFKASRLLSL